MHILVIHGPNLNMLGIREPSRYGSATLESLNQSLSESAIQSGCTVSTFQSNIEGELVDAIQRCLNGTSSLFESYPLATLSSSNGLREGDSPNVDKVDKVDGILINPAAYTHTSIAIRDALLAVSIPFVEVHMSNIYAREAFRHHSFLSNIAVGTIVGFGQDSYLLGLNALIRYISTQHMR